MAEYISTFTTGFSDVIPEALTKILPGAKVLKVYDGLVNYIYEGKEENVQSVLIFNNSFLVIRKFQGRNCEMTAMVKNIISLNRLPVSRKSFRIRYSVNNQFVGMEKSYTRQIEEKICRLTNAKIDRVSPQIEYWFIKRSENIGFFCRLLNKRKFTEKNLNKGELRPEFAYLMCMLGGLNKSAVVMDPFAGYGAIPKQIKKHFRFSRLYVSDINPECERKLGGYFDKKKNIDVALRDALNMHDVENNSIDTIITDPPWGFYEQINDIEQFYVDMLKEFKRVLKSKGRLILLSARKEEFESAAQKENHRIDKKYDTLVNGKKASVYVVSM